MPGLPGSGGQSLGTAQGSIVINTASLAAAQQVAQQAGQRISQSLNQINTGAQTAQRGVSGLSAGFVSLRQAAGIAGGIYGALQLVRISTELAANAANADRTRGAFNTLAQGVGVAGGSMLASMRKASKGMIADTELVIGANQAMLLGVAHTSAEMGDLLNASRVLGQAMGKDVSSSYHDLVIGLGRLSPRILDNLGIANEGEKIFDSYAASIGRTADSLSNAEKMQVLMNQVMRAAKPLLDAEARTGDNAANKFERFDASLKNAKTALGDLVLALGVPGLLDGFNTSITGGTANLRVFIESLAIAKQWGQDMFAAQMTPSLINLTQRNTAPLHGMGVSSGASLAATVDPNLGKQQTDQMEWYQSIKQIERSANADRLSATQQYESQRSETIRSYEQGIAREAQDFAISRARAATQLAETIADIGRDSAKQAAQWAADLAESIADMQADSGERVVEAQESTGKRLAELNEDYAKSRERAARDHNDNLLEAAANLDARAVFNEQKNFARSSQDAKDAHEEQINDLNAALAERVEKERENLAERIADAQEADARRLKDAKEADEERIADAKESLIKQQAQEDEDRAIRLARGAEDQAAQLSQMAVAQAERLAQIEQHAKEERTQLDEEFLKQLDEDGLRNERWMQQQAALKALALKQFDDWWLKVLGSIGKVQGPISQADKDRFIDPAKIKPYESGGAIARTGPIYAHAGEYMLNKSVVDRMGGFSGAQQVAMNGGRSNTINLAPGSIAIYAHAGMNEEAVGDVVERRLLYILENKLN